MDKSADAFRTISEVAGQLKLPQHVLRFWETRFPQVRPLKRGGNRRFYRPDDVELLLAIKTLLYSDGFTIKGVQRILKERGPRAVASLARDREAGLLKSGGGADVGSSDDVPSGDDDEAGFDASVSSSDEPLLPFDIVDRLQAVLFELSECRRILNALHE